MTRRRPGTAWSRGVVPYAAGLLLLTGCAAGPVEVDAPAPEAEQAATCRDFVAGLPATLADLEQREVSGGDGLVAAWGDPAVVLTCGVDVPDDFTSTSTCIEANGTGWFVPDDVLLSDDDSLDVTMTAVGFRPRVRVEVPGELRPGGFQGVSGALGRIVADELELVEPCR